MFKQQINQFLTQRFQCRNILIGNLFNLWSVQSKMRKKSFHFLISQAYSSWEPATQWGMQQPGMPGCYLAVGLFCEQGKYRHLCLLLHWSDQLKNHIGIGDKRMALWNFPSHTSSRSRQNSKHPLLDVLNDSWMPFCLSYWKFTGELHLKDFCMWYLHTAVAREHICQCSAHETAEHSMQPDIQKFQ